MGLLRDRLAAGKPGSLFASASLAHPQALAGAGRGTHAVQACADFYGAADDRSARTLGQEGSISQAAVALGLSYRHVWGALKHWESVLGQPLVLWIKGRHARLTPYAGRLLWAERQASVRMTQHVEALRTELNRVFAQAEDTALLWLDIAASHDLGLPVLQQQADGRCAIAGFHVPR